MVKGINMFAIPVIRYSAAFLNWSVAELTQLILEAIVNEWSSSPKMRC